MADDFSLEVTGLAAANGRIWNFIKAMPDEIEAALRAEAQEFLDEAVKRCPWKTRALQKSGKLHPTEKRGYEHSIMLSFGEGLTYAFYVHEDLTANHPNGGQAKFLESVVTERGAGVAYRVSQRIKLERAMKK